MHIKAATGPQGDHQGITSTSQGDRKGITREPCSFTRQHAAVSVTSDSPLRWGMTCNHEAPVLSSSVLSLFKGLAAIFSGGCDSRGASAGSSFTLDTFRNSPPARWGLLDFIRVVLLLLLLFLLVLLLHHLCLHFHVHFCLANSSPSSSPTSARSGHCWTSTARVWAHWAPLDLNLGPSELSEHRWTSTWDRPSSVSTPGPQPGTIRAQWALLDLNLGPSELSEHRWPSTAR